MEKFKLRKAENKFSFKKIEGIGICSLIPEAPPEFLHLLDQMLKINPEDRIDVKEALDHPFFYSLTELKKYRKAIIGKIT